MDTLPNFKIGEITYNYFEILPIEEGGIYRITIEGFFKNGQRTISKKVNILMKEYKFKVPGGWWKSELYLPDGNKKSIPDKTVNIISEDEISKAIDNLNKIEEEDVIESVKEYFTFLSRSSEEYIQVAECNVKPALMK